MTTYTAVLDNSKTNVEGHSKFLNRLVTGGVPTNFSSTSMAVVQRGAGANMSVDVSIGDVHLERPTADYSFWGWQDAVTNVTITTSNPSNPRIDAIVAWCDTSVTTTGSNNSPGSLKFSAIAGTAAGSPTAPIDATIQTALGASVAWTRLANVTVPAAASSIVTANISDTRTAVTLRSALASNSVKTASITDANVTSPKLSLTAIESTLGSTFNSASSATWQDTGLSVTLTTAGTWRMDANIRANTPATGGAYCVLRLYNVTTGAAITNSERLVTLNPTAAIYNATVPIAKRVVTATANNVIRVELLPGGSYSCSVVSDSNGRSELSALGIG